MRIRQRAGATLIASTNHSRATVPRAWRPTAFLVTQGCVAVVLAGCAVSPFATSGANESATQPLPDFEANDAAAPQPDKPVFKGENRAAVAHPKPAPPPVDPKSVVGATEIEAMRLLGAPSAIADRAPALIWEYSAKRCALSLHFYMDMNTRTYRVLTYDVAPKSVAEPSCFASVRNGGG